MKTTQMRTGKGCLFRACSSRGTCVLETCWQAEEWESCIEEQREGFSCAQIGGRRLGKLEAGSLEAGQAVIGWGSTPGFLWLALSWKQGQKLGKLSVINQDLVIFF